MAVRTLHQAFGNAVAHGQRELRLRRGVAAETKVRLLAAQQAVLQPARLVALADADLLCAEEFSLRCVDVGLHALLAGAVDRKSTRLNSSH